MDGRLARGDRPGACSGAPRIGPVPARSRGQATATIGMLTAVAAANATRVALEVEENNGGAVARRLGLAAAVDQAPREACPARNCVISASKSSRELKSE